jgi:hypothetical protein
MCVCIPQTILQAQGKGAPRIAITNIAQGTCFQYPFAVDFKILAEFGTGSVTSVKLYGFNDFRTNRVLIGTATNTPFVVRWISTGSDYHWSFQAEATDIQGGTFSSEPLELYTSQDPSPPTLSITRPNGSGPVTPDSPFEIQMSVWCMEGNAKPIRVYVDGNLFGGLVDYPYQIAHPGLTAGFHTLKTVYHSENFFAQLTNEVRFLVGTFELATPTFQPSGLGEFKLSSSIPNATVIIQSSINMVSWLDVATNASPVTNLTFTESMPTPNSSSRFYRAVLRP